MPSQSKVMVIEETVVHMQIMELKKQKLKVQILHHLKEF